MPGLLPGPRWALTPPFHPYPCKHRAVSSLWRFPWGCPRRALPGTVASWSPDFPRRLLPRSSGHPRPARSRWNASSHRPARPIRLRPACQARALSSTSASARPSRTSQCAETSASGVAQPVARLGATGHGGVMDHHQRGPHPPAGRRNSAREGGSLQGGAEGARIPAAGKAVAIGVKALRSLSGPPLARNSSCARSGEANLAQATFGSFDSLRAHTSGFPARGWWPARIPRCSARSRPCRCGRAVGCTTTYWARLRAMRSASLSMVSRARRPGNPSRPRCRVGMAPSRPILP
jgi:hypothetical protein